MNVLSLFDGMSCGQIALERADVEVGNYFASEIDKYAIEVTKNNFPNTKHIGSVVARIPNISQLVAVSFLCTMSAFPLSTFVIETPRRRSTSRPL